MSSVSGPRESGARPLSGVFQQEASPTKPMPKAAGIAAAAAEPSVHYTCFIRLPFPRADFVDPQQVEWSSAKDRLLWKTISKASNSKELDWEELSTRFDVSLPFLLQQAAWLYERHFAQMKAQMKKLSPSANPSPIPPDSASNSSTPITGTFAANSLGPRTTSALSTRARESPTPTTAGSGNSATIRPAGSSSVMTTDAPFPTHTTSGPSRTPSVRTVTQSSRTLAPNSPVPTNTNNRSSFRSSFGSTQRKPTTTQAPPENIVDYDSPPPAETSDSESSSSDEDVQPTQSMARSQAFRRPPHFGGGVGGGGGAARKSPAAGLLSYTDSADSEEDEDGESSGGFLPFAAAGTGKNEDVTATLRSAPKRAAERLTAVTVTGGKGVESSATSSESSNAAVPMKRHGQPSRQQQSQQGQQGQQGGHGGQRGAHGHHRHHHDHHQRSGSQGDVASALSPKHRAELSALSPRSKREGSEGAPSMGSSFSDLDDASISQSALEDAYLSNMQRGGTASRMSTISQALKSRYL